MQLGEAQEARIPEYPERHAQAKVVDDDLGLFETGSAPAAIARATFVRQFSRPRAKTAPMDLACSGARRTSAGGMRRLWWAISAMRDGLRSPRRQGQTDRRDADGRPSRDQTDPRRSRQVRYRVRELPPGADVSSAHERVSSGSSSVGGASAFQAECRGFESRLPLQLPRFGLSPRLPLPCRRGAPGAPLVTKRADARS